MANICNNEFYAQGSNRDIKTIKEFFDDWRYSSIDMDDDTIDVQFDSKWDFPIKEMEKLYNLIKDKDEIYMRCLSVEYGNDYVAYWKCEEEGWYQIV